MKAMRHRALSALRVSVLVGAGAGRCDLRTPLDGAGTAQRGEGRLAAHTLGVVTGGGEQRGRDLCADAGGCQQSRVGLSAQVLETLVELGCFRGEGLMPTGQHAQRSFELRGDGIGA